MLIFIEAAAAVVSIASFALIALASFSCAVKALSDDRPIGSLSFVAVYLTMLYAIYKVWSM